MGYQGGVWYLTILGGCVHFKCVIIPGGENNNGIQLRNLVLIPIIIPYGALTVKHCQGLLGKNSLRPKWHIYVGPGVQDPRVSHTKVSPRQLLTPLRPLPSVRPVYHKLPGYHPQPGLKLQFRRTGILDPINKFNLHPAPGPIPLTKGAYWV